ncbi:ATP-binding protein [Kaistia dalseonensis]|uniref:histidine kinase n=1 Tax=Kaistia dalseonensis TaxID=410840 RepID=A0ABU0H262_9HYPH|nr:ATP-binding protein [Kaistia dalseonensis]MCX5493308.1 ATP-binding protein [Kaistia dalseonensis]MDQ0435865.1 signal transduction histidine kinase [Kaistia dalseonensis]
MSLKTTAFLWLAALMTIIGLIAAIVSYGLMRAEADDFLDGQLRRIAIYVGDGEPKSTAPPPTSDDENDPDDDFLVQVWNRNGDLIRISDPSISIPRQTLTGFTSASASGETWRVYTLADEGRTVQISQQMTVRNEFATSAAVQAAIPTTLLIPLSWLILNWIISRVIGRLDQLALAVGRRDPSDGTPIPLDDVPQEVIPFVTSINVLLARLRTSLERQRRFVSDAAHQLRTPLTALRIQIGGLQTAKPTELSARLAELDQGVQRSSALVSQLLSLARYDASEIRGAMTPLDLTALTLDCIARIAPVAEQRGIDLGVVRQDAAEIMGSAADLAVAIDNLLDNAIRYTPPGGTVDVAIIAAPDGASIEIRDTGPGIDEAALQHVFERFYRAAPPDIEGSGLGLAIARAAAERSKAVITLANRTPGPGLVARLDISVRG